MIFGYLLYSLVPRVFCTNLTFLNKKRNSIKEFLLQLPWARLELALDLTPTGF